MTIDKEITQSAQKWLDLLRERAKVSYTVELASSSVNDLANVLDNLLKSHATLTEACKDIEVVRERLAKLEKGAAAQQNLNRPTVVKTQPRVTKEDVNDAVA
jgi:hypothetical protein